MNPQNDRPPLPAIAAIRSSKGDILFVPEGDNTVSTISRFQVEFAPVYEIAFKWGHWFKRLY